MSRVGERGKNTNPIAEFIQQFAESVENVKEFEKGYKLLKFINKNALLLFFVFTVSVALTAAGINEFTSFTIDPTNAFIIATFTFILLFLYVYRAVSDRLEDHDLSKKTLIYHYLAVAIERYYESDYSEVHGVLNKASDWLQEDDNDHIHQKQKSALIDYVDILNNRPEEERKEILKSTFESILIPIAEQIVDIEDSPFTDVLEEVTRREEEKDSITTLRFFLESVTDVGYPEPLKGVSPFLAVGIIGFIIFTLVNKQLGMLTVMVFTPAVQYFVNRGESD